MQTICFNIRSDFTDSNIINWFFLILYWCFSEKGNKNGLIFCLGWCGSLLASPLYPLLASPLYPLLPTNLSLLRKTFKKGLKSSNWEKFRHHVDSDTPDLVSVVNQLNLRRERAKTMEIKILSGNADINGKLTEDQVKLIREGVKRRPLFCPGGQPSVRKRLTKIRRLC